MELKIKKFDELTVFELFQLMKARVNVFVVEQQCPYPEVDDTDLSAVHMFYEDDDGSTAAYLRIFSRAEEPGAVRIGRVLTTRRSQGLGGRLLHEALEYIRKKTDASEIRLEAQTYAVGFYEKEGFTVTSGEFIEDGIPHVRMRYQIRR